MKSAIFKKVECAAFALLSCLTLLKFLDCFNNWNSARLARTFAPLYGYSLYYGPDSGPRIGTLYGPIGSLAYLPAAIFRHPVPALLTAEFIAILFFFGPVAWIFARRGTLIGFLVFCLFAFYSPPLKAAAFYIHVDAPALGLAALSAAVLVLRNRPNTTASLALSALLGALAFWSKQSVLPAFLALAGWLLIVEGPRAALAFTGWLAVSFTVLLLAFSFLYDLGDMYFNLVTVIAHTPFGSYADISRAFHELIQYSLLPAFLLVFCVFYRRSQAWSGGRLKDWLKDNPWSVFALIGLLNVPTSLLGRMIMGGADNNYAYAVYFLAIAAILGLGRLASKERPAHVLLVSLAVTLLIVLMPQLISIPRKLARLGHVPALKAYDYAKRHPGDTYFPWNTLSMLLAEGKLYHYEWGMEEREQAGYPMTRESFLAFTPKNFRRIAVKSDTEGVLAPAPLALRFFPDFKMRVSGPDGELPGWQIYE